MRTSNVNNAIYALDAGRWRYDQTNHQPHSRATRGTAQHRQRKPPSLPQSSGSAVSHPMRRLGRTNQRRIQRRCHRLQCDRNDSNHYRIGKLSRRNKHLNPRGTKMRSLDRCEVCRFGQMKTVTTRSKGLSRKRYLRCNNCGSTGKEILRIDHLGRQVFILDSGTTPSILGTTHNPSSTKQ